MRPNRYTKESQPPHFYQPSPGLNFPASILIPNILGMDFVEQQKALERAQGNIQLNNSIDSLLHVHRRKLQRRAANRKSAQLSRARKKAHLEELTQENTRLQQLVDVLDSQPELMFCINSRGDITYISERTINFINIGGTTNEGSEEDPTHISQILSKSSVDDVLATIQEIMRVSPPKSALAEANMLFSSKVVEFQDSFGHPLVGYLRCSRVNRRPIIEEAIQDEVEPDPALITPTMIAGAKRAKLRQEAEEQEINRIAAAAAAMPFYGAAGATAGLSNSSVSSTSGGSMQSQMDLSNFRMLTECMTTMTDSHGRNTSSNALNTISQDASIATTGTGATGTSPRAAADAEADSEFVCVIRTSDSYFARYSTRSDLYMFVSTPLSAESIEAHDEKSGRTSRQQLSASSRNSGSTSLPEVTNSTGASHKTSSDTLPHSQAGTTEQSAHTLTLRGGSGGAHSPHRSSQSGASNISGQKRSADERSSDSGDGRAGPTDRAGEDQH